MGFLGPLVTGLESEVQKASMSHQRWSPQLCGCRSKRGQELDDKGRGASGYTEAR